MTNLGFPYSSVENDYLYYNTPDGIFTIFASDRITKKESEVTIFSVLYDATPIKQSVEQDKAYGISLLKTQKEKAKESGTSNKKTDSEYAKTSNKIRELVAITRRQQNTWRVLVRHSLVALPTSI